MAGSESDREEIVEDEDEEKPVPQQRNAAVVASKSKLLKILRYFEQVVLKWKNEASSKNSVEFVNKYIGTLTAEQRFFNRITISCNALHAMVIKGDLQEDTAIKIFDRISETFKTLVGLTDVTISAKGVVEAKQEESNPQADMFCARYTDTTTLPSEQPQRFWYEPTDKMNRFAFVKQEIKKMQADCQGYIEQDGLEWKHAAKVIQGLKIAGVILGTLLAAAAGVALMFLLGNYGHQIFAEKIADVISTQIGTFLSAGSAVGVGGFFASRHVFFKMGTNARASRDVNKMGEALQTMLRAKINDDDPKGSDTCKNILFDALTGDANGKITELYHQQPSK